MKQRRLYWLLAIMLVLAIARAWVPPSNRQAPQSIAQAIVRKPAPIAKATPAPAVTLAASAADVPLAPGSAAVDDLDDAGNAFAVRPPPPPPYVPPAPQVAQVKPVAPAVAPVPTEPPVPAPPYQVIGTWDDGKEPGVFLASPNGTLFAHLGATLQAEYKVTAITPQQITLQHLASKREVRLTVPRPSPSTSSTTSTTSIASATLRPTP
jgi:hypothetical protein